MFKTVLTLFRGSVAAAGEELEDRSALLILDQQMRDAAVAVERSKRMLALAIAQDRTALRSIAPLVVPAERRERATWPLRPGRRPRPPERRAAVT